MTASSRTLGHLIVWVGGDWCFGDGAAISSEDRPCVRCGRMPTSEEVTADEQAEILPPPVWVPPPGIEWEEVKSHEARFYDED